MIVDKNTGRLKIEYRIIKDCWICTSHAPNSSGYPKAMLDGRSDSISRHYYKKYKGKIPKGMLIRHTCDNTMCINPKHLLIGNQIDNINDMVRRKRNPTCEKHGRSKIVKEQVIIIFNDNKTSRNELSKIYKVDSKVIRDIKNRVTWKNVTDLL
jgi:hypothetical protein